MFLSTSFLPIETIFSVLLFLGIFGGRVLSLLLICALDMGRTFARKKLLQWSQSRDSCVMASESWCFRDLGYVI